MSEQEIVKNYPGSPTVNHQHSGDGSFASGDIGGATATSPSTSDVGPQLVISQLPTLAQAVLTQLAQLEHQAVFCSQSRLVASSTMCGMQQFSPKMVVELQ